MTGDRLDLEAELYSPRRRSAAIGEAPPSPREPAWSELYAELAAHERQTAAERRLRIVS